MTDPVENVEPPVSGDTQAAELEALAVAAEAEEKAEQDALAEDQQAAEDNESVEGEYQSKEPDQMSTGQLCTALISVGFSLVAARKGQHWELTEAEATETGEAVGGVLDKYFPDMANHGPEVAALLTVGMVVTPRLMMDSKISQAKALQRAEAARKAQGKPDEKEEAPQLDMEVGIDGD